MANDNKNQNKNGKKTTIAGQALIEGILMRGPERTAIVCRKPGQEPVVKLEPHGTNTHGAWARLPVVAGISYEINRFAGRHDNWFTMALRAPGLALQRLTTAEPDDSMIEVAILAMKEVIPQREEEDNW